MANVSAFTHFVAGFVGAVLRRGENRMEGEKRRKRWRGEGKMEGRANIGGDEETYSRVSVAELSTLRSKSN